MLQPRFWNSCNIFALLLLPFAFLYNIISKLNLFIHSLFAYRSSKFVISVGNINIGGTGKSQLVLFLANSLADLGFKVAVVMRGYNGALSSCKHSVLVDNKIHSFYDVGDEALMISFKSNADVFVNKNRKLSFKMIDNSNYDFVIMDDAMQNASVKKDFSICVIDGVNAFKNSLIIPAGPLRESVNSAVKKSDAFVIVRDDRFNIKNKLVSKNVSSDCIFNASIVSDFSLDKDNVNFDSPVVAFCSIAEPDKFFQSLSLFGFRFIDKYTFSDHYNYSENDVKLIVNRAVEKYGNDVLILTTDKDYVKIPTHYKKFIKNFSVKLDVLKSDVLIRNILLKFKNKV